MPAEFDHENADARSLPKGDISYSGNLHIGSDSLIEAAFFSFPGIVSSDPAPQSIRGLHLDETLPQLHESRFARHANCPHYSPINQTSGTCTIAKEGEVFNRTKVHCDNYASCETYASVKRSLKN